MFWDVAQGVGGRRDTAPGSYAGEGTSQAAGAPHGYQGSFRERRQFLFCPLGFHSRASGGEGLTLGSLHIGKDLGKACG